MRCAAESTALLLPPLWVFNANLPRTLPSDFGKMLCDFDPRPPATPDVFATMTRHREKVRGALETGDCDGGLAAVETYLPYAFGLLAAAAEEKEVQGCLTFAWTAPFTNAHSSKPAKITSLQSEVVLTLQAYALLHRKLARDLLASDAAEEANLNLSLKHLTKAAGIFESIGFLSASLLVKNAAAGGASPLLHELTPEFQQLMLSLLEAQEIAVRKALVAKHNPVVCAKLCMDVFDSARHCKQLVPSAAAEYRFRVLEMYLTITGQAYRGAACSLLATYYRDGARGKVGSGAAVGFLHRGLPDKAEAAIFADRKSKEHMTEFIGAVECFNEKLKQLHVDAVHENETVYFESVPADGDVVLPGGACVVKTAPFEPPRPADCLRGLHVTDARPLTTLYKPTWRDVLYDVFVSVGQPDQ